MLSVGWRTALIVLFFVAIIAGIFLLTQAEMTLLAGVRAYVGGESLWSKAQKEAVFHLTRYADSRREEDYRRYLSAIAVPLGDAQARRELEQPQPDMDLVRSGFLQGGNHPEDIASMVRLFQRFHRVGYLANAIAIWTEADGYIDRLRQLGDTLHDEISSGGDATDRVATLLDEIHEIDDRLTPLETGFSRALADGARAAKAWERRATTVAALLLATFGVVLSWRLMRSEARERDSQMGIDAMLHTALDCIVTIDADGRIIEFNPAAERTFGVAREAVLGKELAAVVIPPQLRDRHRQGLARFVASGHGTIPGRRIEISGLRGDGSEFPCELSITPIHRQGRLLFTGHLRDISERHRAETERAALLARERAARRAAEAANRAKDEFLATLSHELPTPLGPILGWVQLLREDDTDTTLLPEALETIGRNATLQLRLIEDLLDVARITSGKLQLQPHRCDLRGIVTASLETVRLAADGKGIALDFAIAAEPVPVLGDPKRLQQVVWNLLSNAVKFTPRGGRVDVRVARDDGQASVSVRDTGKGIEPWFLPHVFGRFQQEDESARTTGGLGLGLAIVRDLVELHGGTVSADSDGPGHGATFTVRLPLAPLAEG